jgi:hypothetical protein
LEESTWSQLQVFENRVRIEIIQLLMDFEIMSLSEIRKQLQSKHDRKISLPGILRHMRVLEKTGIILLYERGGGFGKKEDARKNSYMVQGKERVIRALNSWSKLSEELITSKNFLDLRLYARSVFLSGNIPQEHEKEKLHHLINQCEQPKVFCCLSEDEKKKIEWWKKTISIES